MGTVRRELPDMHAAGAVVIRKGKQVLLVHRPKYDDWSFPKGKLERGEHRVPAAVREVHEETGVHVRLGPPLPDQRYPLTRRMKTVHYWVGRAVGSDDISHYWPNNEIDDLRWVSFDQADKLLTYPYDRHTLRSAYQTRKKTGVVVVLRHADARSRKRWRADDRLRPLLKVGERQAAKLVPLLAAYDVSRLVSSSSTRCVQTLQPYADLTALRIRTDAGLCEENATPESVLAQVDRALESRENVVICSHRPVLPSIFSALGQEDVKLATGEFMVFHHRDGEIVAIERHGVR